MNLSRSNYFVILNILNNFLLRFFTLTRFLSCFLFCISFYFAHHFNVLEYAQTIPFKYFQYPLEINLKSLVEKTLAGKPPQVFPLNDYRTYPFIFNSHLKCKDEEGNQDEVYLLLVIKSRLENYEMRNMIRKTWGRQFGLKYNVRRVFLLGVDPENKELQHRIGLENQDYEDIVQQFFIDNYFNNTLKLMMGFQWVVEYCENARFVAFTDDDFFVNVKKVISMFQKLNNFQYENSVVGYLWQNPMPYRIHSSKWYISLQEYPYRFWPPFVSGGAFFMGMPVVEKIKVGIQFVKMIRFDDVFLGIVCYKLGLSLIHHKGIYIEENFTYNKVKFREVMASHGFKNVEFLYKVWKDQKELENTPDNL